MTHARAPELCGHASAPQKHVRYARGVHKADEAPDPLGDIEEENNLMGGDFKGANFSTARRCRILVRSEGGFREF